MKLKIKILTLFVLLISSTPAVSSAQIENKEEETDIILAIGEEKASISKSQFSDWIFYNPSIEYNPSYFSELENPNYCPLDDIYCSLTISLEKKRHFRKFTRAELDNDKIRIYLEELSKKYNTEPIDAKFELEGNRVIAFSKSENGKKIDIEKSVRAISSVVPNFIDNENIKVSIPLIIASPKITEEDINNYGVNSLIASGESDFKGSTNSRIHNIKTAVSEFHGLLIKPGDEFSFVKNLGEVDGENGYLPELVIKSDRTEPEFGGGICQVSTTMFRAAIYSGLEITARRNHAYPVKYYSPQGMDATIYIPWPDLRFKNNTPAHILIQGRIEGTKLYFDFYGTDDGRKVEVDGPHVTQRNADGSMKTYFVQKVFARNGAEIINETFRSSYDSPSKYPQPGQETLLTEKPKNWSDGEWRDYKKAHGL